LKKLDRHLQVPQHGPRSGGISIIYKNYFQATTKDTGIFKSFEHLTGYFSLRHIPLLVIVLYRPGSEGVIKTSYMEFAELLSSIVKYNCKVLILGDVNIHLDELNNSDTKSSIVFFHLTVSSS